MCVPDAVSEGPSHFRPGHRLTELSWRGRSFRKFRKLDIESDKYVTFRSPERKTLRHISGMYLNLVGDSSALV